MGIEWYDMIARKNGGYKNTAVFTVEGVSAEDRFEQRLIAMLPNFKSVLDAGCGHGEFTLKMSSYTPSLVGLDNSIEMIKIAKAIHEDSKVNNVLFEYASTKTELPFKDQQFDLIYNRRGPTSIINHSRILGTGGTIFGIHSGALDTVKQRLSSNGFIGIEIEEFNSAVLAFPNEIEFAKFLSEIPGNPDYTASKLRRELDIQIENNTINGRIAVREYRYI
ncbi:putative methyltransferase YcgJ [compost metagenome]